MENVIKYLNETYLDGYKPLTREEEDIMLNNPSKENIIEIIWIDISNENYWDVVIEIKNMLYKHYAINRLLKDDLNIIKDYIKNLWERRFWDVDELLNMNKDRNRSYWLRVWDIVSYTSSYSKESIFWIVVNVMLSDNNSVDVIWEHDIDLIKEWKEKSDNFVAEWLNVEIYVED